MGKSPAVMIDLPRLVSRTAAWYGSDIAVIDGERRMTFAGLEDRSNRLANALYALSSHGRARVGLLLGNRLEFVEADLAILKAGKVKVPLNPRLSPAEREYILSHSAADTLIFEASHEDFVAQVRERLPALANLIRVDGVDALVQAQPYEELLAQASDRPPQAAILPEDPSVILYTSGTTGRPKGATSSYSSRFAATLNMLADELDVRAGDGMIHVGPLSHGSGSKILAYYLRGARNILARKFDPEDFYRIVHQERGTSSFMVPTMIAMLLENPSRPEYDISSLRTITYGGAPISPQRIQHALDVFGPIFVQVYGSCEAPHPVTVLSKWEHECYREDARRLSSLGRESTAVEIRVADLRGAERPVGEPGELLIRGPNVMVGYWNDPEATSAAFVEGFYRSGDAAVRDDKGYLYMVDRMRDLVITGGLNVYPAEVEAALLAHPAVLETAVIGVPDETWGESLKAFVVLRPGAHATTTDLVEHCRGQLASYKKPKSVEFVRDLPKGSTGKVLKRELREAYWHGRDRRVN